MKKITMEQVIKLVSGRLLSPLDFMEGYNHAVEKHNAKKAKKRNAEKWESSKSYLKDEVKDCNQPESVTDSHSLKDQLCDLEVTVFHRLDQRESYNIDQEIKKLHETIKELDKNIAITVNSHAAFKLNQDEFRQRLDALEKENEINLAALRQIGGVISEIQKQQKKFFDRLDKLESSCIKNGEMIAQLFDKLEQLDCSCIKDGDNVSITSVSIISNNQAISYSNVGVIHKVKP